MITSGVIELPGLGGNYTMLEMAPIMQDFRHGNPTLFQGIKPSHHAHERHFRTPKVWNKFFKDLELWEEIEKDVRRTRSDMTFFIEAVDRTKNKDKEQLRKQAEVKKAHLHGDVRLI